MKVYLVDSVLVPVTAAKPGPLLPPKGQIYPTFGNAVLTTPGLEYFSYLVKKAGLTSYFNNPKLKGTLLITRPSRCVHVRYDIGSHLYGCMRIWRMYCMILTSLAWVMNTLLVECFSLDECFRAASSENGYWTR